MSIVGKLESLPCIILDGAMGTELERLGAPMNQKAWCATAMESHPELVRQVHRNYISAGAHVITTNTYASPPHVLSRAGLSHRTVEWNRQAITMAREERDRMAPAQPVFIAGSVSTLGHNNTDNPVSEAEMRSSFRQQSEILAEEGVDLLLLETLAANLEVVFMILEESLTCGLPVWLGISCLRHRQDGRILHGIQESTVHSDHRIEYESFASVISALSNTKIDALLMMHSELSVTEAAVEHLVQGFPGAVGVYPNAGYWTRPEWAFVDQISPREFAEHAQIWHDKGARIIGGCCGIGPDHIVALADKWSAPV